MQRCENSAAGFCLVCWFAVLATCHHLLLLEIAIQFIHTTDLVKKIQTIHELFLDNKTHKIIKLVNDFDILSVVDIPKAFNKTVSNAFVISNTVCNSMCLLCCDDMYFYVLD